MAVLRSDRNTYFLVIRLFNMCEFATITMLIYHIIKNDIIKKVLLYSIPVFVSYGIIDYLTSNKDQFNNHSQIISTLLLIIFIIYYFFEKMKTVVMYPLYQSITFWIFVSFFIYFTGNFFFFIFSGSSDDEEFKKQMNMIYSLVTITKNILLCLAVLATENLEQKEDVLDIPNHMDLDEFSPTNLKNS